MAMIVLLFKKEEQILLELKTYKNYKQLCEDMGWSTVRGNTKVKHLKNWTRYVSGTRKEIK